MGSSMLCFNSHSFVFNLIHVFLILTLLLSLSFSQPVCHDEERSSLLQFKESFVINKSASDAFGAYSKVASWSLKEDCCRWDGVECDEITGHVITLNLGSSYLYGSIDSNSSLFNLVHLQSLNLTDNHFNYSRIPTAIKRLSMLTSLDLSYSVFSGQIPFEVSQLSKLLQLSLCCNFDPVSEENLLKLKKSNFESLISNLTSLEELSLTHVNISSTVPKLLANLTSLTSLFLRDCSLKGEFPLQTFQLPNLQHLSIQFNEDLSGRLPSVLNETSSLKSLRLSGTRFYGNLPLTIGKLASLTELHSSQCNFSGVIPASIGTLNKLTSLHLAESNLFGNIPSSIGNLTKLSEFDLSSNQLSGPIPLSLSNLINLEDLFLGDNNLSGNVEFNMFNSLKKLINLGLSYNRLSVRDSYEINDTFPQLSILGLGRCNLGNFPNFLRHQKTIQILNLNDNHIGGQIPDWILSIARKTLSAISLSKNSLIGELSPAICNLSSLNVLQFSHNKLSGKLPNCFGKFSKSVSIIKLRNNSFFGNIPEFTKGNQLRILDLGYNLFQGKLPKSFTNCKMLGYLNVERNKLNDVFPYWLGTLPELQVLMLQANEFHGVIGEPHTNSHFPKLRVIDISYNNFIGKLPLKYIQSWKAMRSTNFEVFGYMTSILPFQQITNNGLRTVNKKYYFGITISIKGKSVFYGKIQNIIAVINLASNKFDGEIPDIIGSLKGLYSLDLSNNRFKGGIPPSLENLTKLESLDLSQNELSGKIPSGLDQLSFLQYFNVSHNNLSGPIPQSHLNTFDNNCYEGNLGLCGIPLQNSCGQSKPLELPLPSSDDDEEEEDSSSIFQFGWKVVAIGYGCGFLIGFLVERIVTARKPRWLVMTFGIRR